MVRQQKIIAPPDSLAGQIPRDLLCVGVLPGQRDRVDEQARRGLVWRLTPERPAISTVRPGHAPPDRLPQSGFAFLHPFVRTVAAGRLRLRPGVWGRTRWRRTAPWHRLREVAG